MANNSDFSVGFDPSTIIACSTASGACYHRDPREMLMPEPIYETRITKKEPPVSEPTDVASAVATMKLLDYDPNKPLIDADRFNQESRINQQLSLQADARLAAFMHNCRMMREAHPDDINETIETFVNNMVDLYFDGRAPLLTTLRHTTTMKLVMKAELVNLIASHDRNR